MKEYVVSSLIDAPLTVEEIKERANDYGRLSVVLPIYLSDIVGKSAENLLQLFSYMTVGSALMTDIQYHIHGCKGEQLQILVDGDVSSILERENLIEQDYY